MKSFEIENCNFFLQKFWSKRINSNRKLFIFLLQIFVIEHPFYQKIDKKFDCQFEKILSPFIKVFEVKKILFEKIPSTKNFEVEKWTLKYPEIWQDGYSLAGKLTG